MSISFSIFQNLVWRDKVNLELRNQLESYTKIPYSDQSDGLHAHHEEQLIGGVNFQVYNDILWVEGIWVDEKFKRQGIGKLLLERMIDAAKKNNIQSIQLNTFFPESKNFFKACGFEVVQSIPRWKYGLTCYFMRKYI